MKTRSIVSGKYGMKHLFYSSVLLFTLIAIVYPYQMISAGNGDMASVDQKISKDLPAASISWSLDKPEVSFSAEAILRPVSGKMIEFSTQNGMTLNGKSPVKRAIPSLVLYRNGSLTRFEERTAVFEISGLPTTSTAMTLTFQILTQHADPDQGASGDPILVTEKTYPFMLEELDENFVITHTFQAELDPEQGNLATPTDYLQVRIMVTGSNYSEDNLLVDHTEEYALLLENQWLHTFSGLSEEDAGAAPSELVVYYCDMFPFQRDAFDPSSRLPRAEIRQYIEEDLGPQMVSAVETQTNLWDFPWSEAWTSYRGGEDSERLSVALTPPGEWFHGRAPGSAHSGISILTTHNDYESYPTLSDGILGVFHHELFHNIQRNVNQMMGGNGNIDGDDEAWSYFTEGMAIMASSVGQPAVEFTSEGSYLQQANSFLAGNKFEENNLNTSYTDLNPYRGAFYWRFLYEECGGLTDGIENPSYGMLIIRQALISLYSRLDEEQQPGLVDLLPDIMDQAIAATPACPFRSYQDSLTHFARRIYALRYQARNCPKCGRYDIDEMYVEPPVMVINIDETQDITSGGLPASYGMDFIEIELDTYPRERPFRIGFSPTDSKDTVFNVQLVRASGESTDPFEIITSETVETNPSSEEATIYLETGEVPGDVALIITRLDANETVDPRGTYSVSLR